MIVLVTDPARIQNSLCSAFQNQDGVAMVCRYTSEAKARSRHSYGTCLFFHKIRDLRLESGEFMRLFSHYDSLSRALLSLYDDTILPSK